MISCLRAILLIDTVALHILEFGTDCAQSTNGCIVRHYLLAGDEAALPAIARICENLPENAVGQVFLRAENCRYDIAAPSGIQIYWLPRSAASSAKFVERVCDAAMETAASTNDYFLWLANAFSQWQSFRDKLSVLSKKRYLNACYWRDDITTNY